MIPAKKLLTPVLAVVILMCTCAKSQDELNGIVNYPPIVTAMNDTTVNINDSVTITASAVDNGTIVCYVWARNDTDYAETTTVGAIKVAYPDTGRVVIRVKAIDDEHLLSAPDSCVVLVTLLPPVVMPMRDTMVLFPPCSSVTVTVSAHDVNLGGSVVKYYWDIGLNGWEDSTAINTYVITATTAGGVYVRWKVRDNDGVFSVMDTFKVLFYPSPPIVLIAAAGDSFSMGETGIIGSEPVHTVFFTHDFYMDVTEVTQKVYRDLMSATYSGFSAPSWTSYWGVGDNYPAYFADWYDAALYCNARTKATGSIDTVYGYTSINGTPGSGCVLYGLSIDLTKSGYRLPTEAEWEYACRAGTTTGYYWGDTVNGNYCWYPVNSSSTTHSVTTRLPNAWGLYDMAGNVFEWCSDWYADYSSGSQIDPSGPSSGGARVIRGGAWYWYSGVNSSTSLRSAERAVNYPNSVDNLIGFRCVCR